MQDRKLKARMQYTHKLTSDAAYLAAKTDEWLLPSDSGALEAEGMERTYRFKQEEIKAAVEGGAAKKSFELRLTDLGPYCVDFTRDGSRMLIGGRKGHLAEFHWQRQQLHCEVQVKETTRDVKFLHNNLFFAAAQKKYVYIYDSRGIEIHKLKEHQDPLALEFLPHHFLLSSVGESGVLRYQDTSHGQLVAQHKTRLGPCDVMRQNPWNAVLNLGHSNGTVTMWSPNITSPLVKMLCHKGPVRALAVDPTGHYLVTAGVDCQVKVWDVRTFKPLHQYFSNNTVECMDISQKGLLAVGYGRRVQIWKDALSTKQQSPYMTHNLVNGTLRDLAFCPYEDVLALGHSEGVATILIPGAGEANFDTFVDNPFQNKSQRREQEVKQLLDKLQPETIVLDPDAIGTVRKEPKEVAKERAMEAAAANAARKKAQRDENEQKRKMKGKNRPSKRHRKKQLNIIGDKLPEVLQRMREQGVVAARGGGKAQGGPGKEAQAGTAAAGGTAGQAEGSGVPRALARLYKKV